jgi:myo-inositol-1(or 4)-monophosphatase
VDTAIKHRVNAARVAIGQHTAFFEKQLGNVSSEWKADDTRVTFADFAISEKTIAELRRSFPQDDYLSEESGPMDEAIEIRGRYAWILDPIDGTNNFALGISFCAISLALLKDGVPVYGFIYDLSRKELIEGGESFGININGKKTSLRSPHFEEKSSIIAMHFPLPKGRVRDLESAFEKYRIRSMGSAALHLSYVALGRFDGVLDEKVKVWDIAGAYCLLKAVGLEINWLENSCPFPVKKFHIKSPRVAYYAGTSCFCAFLKKELGEHS